MAGMSDGSVRILSEADFEAMLEKQLAAGEVEGEEEAGSGDEPPEPGEPEPGEPEPGEPAKVPVVEVWTNKSGKKIEATLLEVEGDKAVLKMANGRTYSYAITDLDAESQQRVRKFAAAAEE